MNSFSRLLRRLAALIVWTKPISVLGYLQANNPSEISPW
ncbi:unnamed protein product [Acidithrix sp. C25]|nr:unnamed protein product [Acidithrix sp. C25]